MARVGVLGTGIMGAAMARRLLAAGHDVAVWNRTRAKAEPLARAGAAVAASPAEAARGVEAVVTMLADGGAVEAAMKGAGGALGALEPGAAWVQMSTVGARATERLGALAAERGVVFVDAPVLGSKPQAEEGKLLVLASGPEAARERSEALFRAFARATVWVGEAGAGTRLKLVVNSWILTSIENLAETFALARALGVDPRGFLAAIAGGAMDMPYAHTKGEAMLAEEFPPAFPLALARKDVALVLEAAEGKVELPLVRAALAQFDRALALGHGDEDMAAVYYASAG